MKVSSSLCTHLMHDNVDCYDKGKKSMKIGELRVPNLIRFVLEEYQRNSFSFDGELNLMRSTKGQPDYHKERPSTRIFS